MVFVCSGICHEIYFKCCLGICPEIYLEICHAEEDKIKLMVSQNLLQAHPLGVGLPRIPGDHETLSIVRHVGLHVDFSSMKSFLCLEAFTFVCEVNLDGLRPFDQ